MQICCTLDIVYRNMSSLHIIFVTVITYKRKVAPSHITVSRCGLAVRHLAGEAEGLWFDPLRLSFLFSSKIVIYGHCRETLKWFTQLPTLMQNHSGGDSVTSRC